MKKFKIIGVLLSAFAISFGTGMKISLHSAAETENTVTASENLIAHYKFDDATDFGKDSSGNGNDLAVNNASQISQGKYGINLAGTESNGANMGMLYAPYADGTTTDFSDNISGDYTVSFWAVMTGTGYVVQSGQWEGAFSVAHNGADVFTAASAGETKVNFGATPNVWHYVTVSASTTDKKAYYYLDGVLQSTKDMVGTQFTMAATGTVFTLGGQSNPNDNWFANGMKGSFADFRIYNKALSASEIASAMAEAGITAGSDGSNLKVEEPSNAELIAHYKFDDATDMGADSSGKGNNLSYTVNSGSLTKLLGGGAIFGANSALYAANDFSDSLTDYTVSVWLKANFNDNVGYILSSGCYESQFHLSAAYGNAYVHFGTNSSGNSATVGVAGLVANEWNHIVMSASAANGTIDMYINGSNVLSKTGMAEGDIGMANADWAFTVGGQADKNGSSDLCSYNGSMKELRVYNGKLTAKEAVELYAAAPDEVPELIAHYEFADETNLGKDSSGNGNDLLVNGDGVSKGKKGVYLNGDGTSMLYAPYADGTTTDFSDNISGDYTVSFWAVMTGTGYVVQSGQWEGAFSVAHNGADVFTAASAGETKVNFGATPNVWHYVTVSASTTDKKAYYYLDGVLQSTKDMVGTQFTMAATGTVFTLGGQSNPNDNWFANGMKGSFADFRIYNKALDAAMVVEVMNMSGITAGADGDNVDWTDPETEGRLIAHYELKDANNVGKDSTGNHDLSYTKSNDPVTLIDGGGATFAGTSALYDTDDFADLITDYTVSVWVKCDNSGNSGYVMSTGGYENSFHISAAFHKIWISYGPPAGDTVSVDCVTTNEAWTNIIVTASTTLGEVRIYINGELALRVQNLPADKIGMAESTFALTLGAQADENGDSVAGQFTGSIKDVRIYNGMLGKASVAELYAGNIVNAGTDNAIKATDVDNVVSETNTIEVIKANFNLNELVISDGTNERIVKAVWLKDTASEIRAMITECTADPTLVGQVATLSLKYLASITVKGNGSVKINGNADWQHVAYAPGETVEIEVVADEYYACESVIVGRTEYTVANGKVSFAFTGEEIYIDISPIGYTVTLNANGGEIEKTEYEYDVEKSFTLPTPTKAGYIFDGWFETENFTGEAVTAIAVGSNGNKTYYAKWTASYQITYHLDGATNSVENPVAIRADEALVLNAPVKEGYKFLGWYKEESFSNKVESLSGVTADVVLYAKFEVIMYTVTFNVNGGTVIEAITINYGESLTLPDEPAKKGYVFDGWYTDEACENVFAAYSAIKGDVTLYAKWIAETQDKNSGCKSSVFGGMMSVLTLCGAAIVLKKKKGN